MKSEDTVFFEESLEKAAMNYEPRMKLDAEFLRAAFKAGARWALGEKKKVPKLESKNRTYIGELFYDKERLTWYVKYMEFLEEDGVYRTYRFVSDVYLTPFEFNGSQTVFTLKEGKSVEFELSEYDPNRPNVIYAKLIADLTGKKTDL